VLVVWLDGWQVECCGEPFAIGSRVAWTLDERVDRAWLATVLGEALAATVTHAQEHHGNLPEDAPATDAVVTRVRAVSCEYAPAPAGSDGRTHVAVPGTRVVVELHDVRGWYEPAAPLHHVGYLADLAPVGG
jgi:hypothetical protein